MTPNEERFRKEIFVDKVYDKGIPNKDNLIVIDIGGHVGLFDEYILPKAKIIYTIEPCNKVYQKLQNTFKDNDKVRPFNLAIAKERGKRILNTDGADGGSSLIYGDFNNGDEQEVETLSIKDFMEQEHVDHVDLLKVDCEGSEGEILNSQDFKEVALKIDNIVGEVHSGMEIDQSLIHLGYKFEVKNNIFSAKRI